MKQTRLLILYLGLILPMTSWADLYIITHTSTPIETINKEELVSIYLLKKTYWNDNLAITPVNLESKSKAHQQFTHQIFKSSARKMDSYWNQMSYKGATPPTTQASEDSVLSFVKRVPGAIAYLSQKPSDTNVKTLLIIASEQTHPIDKQSVLTALTLNVAQFTQWPDHIFNKTEPILNLCVFGDNVVHQSFESMDRKVINNKTVHIINLSRLRKLNRCQLLYISKLKGNQLNSLLTELKQKPILTIGENMEFLKAGGMVALEKINGKIQLTINLAMIKQAELVISSRLLKLAKIVDFPI